MRFIKALLISTSLLLPLAGCGRTQPPPEAPRAPVAQANTNAGTTQTPSAPPAADLGPALLDVSNKGKTEEVRALLDKGADVNSRDADGRTPLTEAAYNGHAETVKLLLERGGDPNAAKKDGATVYGLANGRGHKEVVELLKKAGAKG